MFTSVFNAWAWLYYPEQKFWTISYSDDLSTSLAYQTKLIFALEWYIKLNNSFKIRVDDNSKSRYSNDKTGTRNSAGMLGTITGLGGDYLIIDDAAKVTDIGELKRKAVINQYKNTIYNRLNNPRVGVRFIIGQRIHKNDLSGYLLENHAENYTHINLPATISDTIAPIELQKEYQLGLLLPELFDATLLLEYKRALGSYGYSAQYEMQPVPVEGGILKYDSFEIIDWKDEFKQLIWHLIIDSAYGRKGGDMSAVLVAAKWNNYLLIKHSYQLSLEFPDLINEIKHIHLEHCNSQSKVFIEPRASGLSVIQSLKRETKFNVLETKTNKNKITRDDKITRCHAISPIVQSKRVFCIDGQWTINFLDEVCNFPLAEFDDQTDTLIYAIEEILNKSTTITYINQSSTPQLNRHSQLRR